MAATQTLLVTGGGALAGAVLSGGTLALIFASTRGGVTLGIPWGWLALLVVGVPLFAAAAAWLLNRPPAARAVRVE